MNIENEALKAPSINLLANSYNNMSTSDIYCTQI